MGVAAAARKTPNLRGEFIGETHRVLKHTNTYPPWNQHQKGPICLWVVGKLTDSQPRTEQTALFPLRPLAHIQHHNTAVLPHPEEVLQIEKSAGDCTKLNTTKL